MKQLYLLVFSLALIPTLQAELKLPAIFGDHMVLQQEQSDPVWGWVLFKHGLGAGLDSPCKNVFR